MAKGDTAEGKTVEMNTVGRNTAGEIAVIELRGSWYEMGCQYGIQAKEMMNDVLRYLDGKLGRDPNRMAAAMDIADKLYANYPGYLKDFFDGVICTSGLSIGRVRLCNAAEFVEGVFLCSVMAVWGDYSKDKMVVGRNYDAVSYREIDRNLVVTVYHPEGGTAVATVGYAGEIYCVNGMNSNGLFVELNNGMPSAGTFIHWELCPSTTNLFEMLFSARDFDDVERFFNTTRSALSLIIGVADKNEARLYEWCYDGVKRGDSMTDKGLMISTNHYVNDEWRFPVPNDACSWNSITRRCNLAARAHSLKGTIDVETMKRIMCTPIEDGGPSHSLTRYRIIAVPEELTMYIYVPYLDRWTKINLTDSF